MYKRTVLGDREILERTLKLSTRLRTLLLLIETQDVNKLDKKILNNENLEYLIALKLIELKQYQNDQSSTNDNLLHKGRLIQQTYEEVNATPELMKKNVVIQNNKKIEIQSVQQKKIEPETTLLPVAMNLNEIKSLMKDTLQKYSGLMSKQLILAIENAQTAVELKTYQKKWLTNLIETKMCKQELNRLLQQINHNMQRIDS